MTIKLHPDVESEFYYASIIVSHEVPMEKVNYILTPSFGGGWGACQLIRFRAYLEYESVELGDGTIGSEANFNVYAEDENRRLYMVTYCKTYKRAKKLAHKLTAKLKKENPRWWIFQKGSLKAAF